MNKTNKPYTPTFTESKSRSVVKRMTPLAWLLTALAVLFVLGLGGAGIGNLLRQNASQRPLSELVTPMPPTTQPAMAMAAAPVTATSKPAAVTIAYSTAQPTGLPSTATPAPFTAPWASKMVKQTDGTYMAPQEVVDAIKAVFKSMEDESLVISKLPLSQGIERWKALNDKYYWPDERDKSLSSLQQNGFYQRMAGSAQVTDVKYFSADGLSAQMSQVARGMVYDQYNVTSLKVTQQGIKADDMVIIFSVRYNPERKQWQILNMDKFTALPKQ